MKTTYSIIFMFTFLNGISQERTITGSIKNNKNQPVGFANILINMATPPHKAITYCFTNEEGIFSFKVNTSIKRIEAIISAVGYKQIQTVFFVDTVKLINLYMENDDKVMQEVIVSIQKIDDTVKLKIDSMNLTGESTLRDILNKTEGMMVTKDGSISYNGKQITKVLINKKEVFVNQNKTALDNLNYEIMENVQIINNYKDKFNIDFNSLSTPVINIKTNDKFKGVFKFATELGYGYKQAYKIKGKGFYFSDNFNLFLTSNTNNISEKDFSFKDISGSIITNSSLFYRSSMLPFFNEDNLVKTDFNSDNSLTLRKQTNSSKIGAVINFANIKTERSSERNISTKDSLIRKENYYAQDKGTLLTGVFNYSHLFSRKTVLNNNTALGFITQNNQVQNDAINFQPQTVVLNELNNSKPDLFGIANNLKLTSLINKKTLINAGINYFKEKSNVLFQTALIGPSNLDIVQAIELDKNLITLFSDLEYKYKSSFSIKGGFSFTQINEKGSIQFNNNGGNFKNINRLAYRYNALVEVEGSGKKIEYSASYSPQILNFGDNSTKNNVFGKTDLEFIYKINYASKVIFKYNRDISLFDLNNSYDTVTLSYNYKVLNRPLTIFNLSRNNNLDIGYYYSNVAKSKSMYFTYTYEKDRNFVQTFFDTTINNVFYYVNNVLDNKKGNTFSLGAYKGFYVTSKYHKIELKLNLSYTDETFPSIRKNQTLQYRNKKGQANFEAGYMPQSALVKEIKTGVRLSGQNLILDNSSINKQNINSVYFSLAANKKRSEIKLYIEKVFYNTPNAKFQIPNFELLFRYKKTEKLSFSVTGKALFDLVGINNNISSSINTFSDGNLITQIINTSRIGYLMFNTIYKF